MDSESARLVIIALEQDIDALKCEKVRLESENTSLKAELVAVRHLLSEHKKAVQHMLERNEMV